MAPSRRSDFRGCFERCRGTSHRSAAARCFDGAAACQVLLRWVVAATPRPLRASRAGGATTCRHRIRGVFRGRNMRSSCSAPRPARSRGARIREGPRGESAAPPRLAGRRCARRTSAQAHPFTDSRPSPASQRPLQSGAQVAAAAQVPTTGRRRRGGTCTYCAWRRKQAAESPGRVLYAPGRPAVCKRGLLPAARGLSGEPEGVGRLRMNDAALCRALCRFRTAAAACGPGGRAAAAGAQDVRVCRRIRFPFLVFRTRAGSPRDIFIPQANSARSQRITPPAQARLPPPSAQPSAPASRSERVL